MSITYDLKTDIRYRQGVKVGEQKSLKKGIRVGEQRGMEKGIKVGEVKGEKKAKMETAVNMMKMGMKLSLIQEVTNLPMSTLKKLASVSK